MSIYHTFTTHCIPMPTHSKLPDTKYMQHRVRDSFSIMGASHTCIPMPTNSKLPETQYIQRRVRDRVRDNTKFVTEFVTHSVSSVHLNTYIRMLIDGELSVDRQTDRCNNTLLFGSNTLTSQSIRLPIWGAYD